MKRILVIALMLTACLQAFGQYNFSVRQSRIIWQRVYETSMSIEQLTDAITLDDHFGNILAKDNTIKCMLRPFDLEHESDGYAGYILMEIPAYFVFTDVEAYVTIQVEEGRYRVTLERFVLIETKDTDVSEKGDKHSLESFVLTERRTFRRSFKKAPADIMDATFSRLFYFQYRRIRPGVRLDDKW